MVDAVVIPTDVVVVHEGMSFSFLINFSLSHSLLVEIVVNVVIHLSVVIVVEMVVDLVRLTHVLLLHDGKFSRVLISKEFFFFLLVAISVVQVVLDRNRIHLVMANAMAEVVPVLLLDESVDLDRQQIIE